LWPVAGEAVSSRPDYLQSGGAAGLLDALGVVVAVLVHDDFRRPAAAVGDKGNLSVKGLHKEVALALGEYWHDALTGRLRIPVIALAGDRQDEAWR